MSEANCNASTTSEPFVAPACRGHDATGGQVRARLKVRIRNIF